ncbi:MAG: hypothetical protein WD750_11155 [Gammaproteobacteria bacterium]
MKHSGGWSLVEIITILIMAGLIIGGLSSLLLKHGFSGGMKVAAVLLLIFIPLMAVIIWKNERDNKKLQQRLREGSRGTSNNPGGE